MPRTQLKFHDDPKMILPSLKTPMAGGNNSLWYFVQRVVEEDFIMRGDRLCAWHSNLLYSCGHGFIPIGPCATDHTQGSNAE